MIDDFVRWNGRVVSAKSCIFSFDAVPYIGIVALDYEDNLEVDKVYGAARDGSPLGTTSGKYNVEDFTVTFLNDVFRKKFLPQMMALSTINGAPLSTHGANFPITCQYVESPLPPDTDVIGGCRLLGAKDAYDEGAGKLVTVAKFLGLSLRRNGIALYDATRLP